jgi:ParB family chromosome partitioning protein
VLGDIDLDPASSDTAQKTVRARRYFTRDDDGRTKPWAGRVWMNPPYARPLVDQFLDKLCQHYAAGDVTAACVLVNNATETSWFAKAAQVAAAICFPTRRVKFLDETGGACGAPLQGQAVIYLGPDINGFVAVFGEFGFCVEVRG